MCPALEPAMEKPENSKCFSENIVFEESFAESGFTSVRRAVH